MNNFNLMNLLLANMLNQKNLQNMQNNPNALNNQNLQNAKQSSIAQNISQNQTLYQNQTLNQSSGLTQNFQNLNSFQTLKSTYNQIFETSTLQNLAKMDMTTTNKYLQSLLEMPENLNLLFEDAATSQNTKLAKLIVENLLDSTKLAQLLNENSKGAIDKVLKAISTSINSANTEITQLKEVLNILKSIHQSTSFAGELASSSLNSSSASVILNTAIKELMLLYIPLNIQAYENTLNQGLSAGEEAVISNCDMAIFFETLNFQNIYASVLDSESGFYITMYMDKSFPKEKFEHVVKITAQKLNINYEFEYKSKKKQ